MATDEKKQAEKAPVAHKSVAEKQAEKDKVPAIQTLLPAKIFGMVGQVGSGAASLKDVKQALREWVGELDDEEKEQLKKDAEQISRTLTLAAEGLSQELSTLVVSL
jgi:hypothetical protein